MAEHTPLSLPSGVTMRVRNNRIAIAHDGHIVVAEDASVPLHTVVSRGGDVELHAAEGLSRVGAAGTLTLHGNVAAAHIQAKRLVVHGTLRAREVQVGSGGVEVHGGLFATKVAVAGDVEIHGPTRADRFGIAGSLSAEELRADEIEVGQDLTVTGALACPTVRVGGNLRVSGPIQSQELTIEGSATLGGRTHADEILAVGLVQCEADIVSRRIRGGVVRLLGATSAVRAVQGADEIQVGAGRIQADGLIAPASHLHPQTSGRVTLLESRNELGPNSVKGCLGLTDLDEVFGGAAPFLDERGLVSLTSSRDPLAAARSVDAEIVVDDDVSEFNLDELDELEEIDELDDLDGKDEQDAKDKQDEATETDLQEGTPVTLASVESTEPPAPEAPQAEPATSSPSPSHEVSGTPHHQAEGRVPLSSVETIIPAPGFRGGAPPDDSQITAKIYMPGTPQVAPAVQEPIASQAAPDDDDELDAPTIDDSMLEPLDEPEERDETYDRMAAVVGRIRVCYDASDEPPAVQRLHDLIETRDYGRVRTELTDIWKQLLKFHQRRGMRIQPQVTTTFNAINSIVRKLPT